MAITKDEFELLFDSEVADPLGQRRFKRVGKSLHATMNLASVSLIGWESHGSARRHRARALLPHVEGAISLYEANRPPQLGGLQDGEVARNLICRSFNYERK